MKRSYKFRAYPTARQEIQARRLLADHCDLYNAALQERRDAYRHSQTKIRYGDQSAQLARSDEMTRTGRARTRSPRSSKPCAACNTVFTAFYQRAQKGQAGYPRFKPRSRFDQVMFVAGDGSKWEPATGKWAQARLQAVGTIKVKQHRRVRGTVKTIQLKREHRRWYVIVVAEHEPESLPETGRQVGVDVGVARFYTTSDGEIADNPNSSNRPRSGSPTCSGARRAASVAPEPAAGQAGAGEGVAEGPQPAPRFPPPARPPTRQQLRCDRGGETQRGRHDPTAATETRR